MRFLVEIEYISTEYNRLYYVIFDKRRSSGFYFWHLFTRKNFHHVYLITKANGGCMVMSPTPYSCEIDIYPDTVDSFIQALPADVTAIVPYVAYSGNLKSYRPRGIINCVTLTKYFLGVGGFSFTPYGLYKKLMRLSDGK